MGFRCQLKPKTPSGAARFSYINRVGKYARDKADLVHSADHNMPEFARKDAMLFWEAADEFERSNARVCLEFELNLPTELKTLEQKIECVEKFIKQLNAKAGKFPTSYAIHSDKNGQNPHVHLMFSERALDGIERPAELFFKRANSKKPELGGTKKSLFFNRSSENVLWTRAAWAEACNETLISSGFNARFDSRTKAAQRLEAIEVGDIRKAVSLSTLTEVHEGPHVGGIRKRLEAGRLTRDEVDAEILEKLDSNDTIKDFNRELKLFAAVAEIEQLQTFLECEKPADRVAFIANLYTPAAALDEQNEDLFDDYDREPQASTRAGAADAGGVQQHTDYLCVVQSRKNNQILHRAIRGSKLCEVQRRKRSSFSQRDSLRTAVQSLGRASSGAVRDVPRAETVSLAGLEKAYSKVERDAFDAELAEDFASQNLEQLKVRAEQIIKLIEEAEPSWFEKPLIKIGLLEDRSLDLKKQLPTLLKQITETEKEVYELDERARSLRADANHLQSKLDVLRVSEPKPASTQSETVQADYAEYLEKIKAEIADAKVESKRQSPQAQDSGKRPRHGPRL